MKLEGRPKNCMDPSRVPSGPGAGRTPTILPGAFRLTLMSFPSVAPLRGYKATARKEPVRKKHFNKSDATLTVRTNKHSLTAF